MPSDSVIVLGFPRNEWGKLRSLLGDFDEEAYLDGEEDIPTFEAELKKAWQGAADEMGWAFKGTHSHGEVRQTPCGERTFFYFNLELYYNYHELGELPEHAMIGIGLSSRYYPRFLDWPNSHGTLYNLRIDPLLSESSIAKKHIARAIPVFEDAGVYVREKFY